PLQLLHLLAGGGIPNVDELVHTATQQFGPVRTNRHAVDCSDLARQLIDFLTSRDVPVACRAVVACRQYSFSVRGQRQASHAMAWGTEAADFADLLSHRLGSRG